MNLSYIAFTDNGTSLAATIASSLGGEVMRCNHPMGLDEWTRAHFNKGEGLVFVGAVGIAVRGIAKYVSDKASDPAVVVVDEAGKFVIPILSGHLGGANELAYSIAEICGGMPVITTATDVNGVFSVDDWARCQNCAIPDTKHIKNVAKRVLSGETVRIRSSYVISGTPPKNVEIADDDNYDVLMDIHKSGKDVLRLVPRIAVLGIGCKSGTHAEKIENAVNKALELSDIFADAVCDAATIDLKANEPGLVDFCRNHGLNLHTYTNHELSSLEGDFSSSKFVESVTGVDNVCERAAVLCSGGELIFRKYAMDGVTVAIAVKPYGPDWRVRNG